MDVQALNELHPDRVYTHNQPHRRKRDDNIKSIGVSLGVSVVGSLIAADMFPNKKQTKHYTQLGIIGLLLLGAAWFTDSRYRSHKRQRDNFTINPAFIFPAQASPA